jgi:hypothetical protein
MVPNARPMSQVASAHPVSSRSQHRVADRPADQRELVPGRGEALPERVEDGGDAVELGGHVPLCVGQPDRARQLPVRGVGHNGSA